MGICQTDLFLLYVLVKAHSYVLQRRSGKFTTDTAVMV